MLKRVVGTFSVLMVFSFTFFYVYGKNIASADITACDASMRAHAVSPNSENSFAITVSDTDANTINWVRITRPSADFTIVSNNASGWSDSTTDSVATETGGALSSGSNMDINLDIKTANKQASPANWTVEVSDNDGQNPFMCSGSLDMAITGDTSDVTPPIISDIVVDNITAKSVRLSWLTDEAATSQVSYGLDNSYGNSTDLDNTMNTQHSVTLTGLSPKTAYHFQVVSLDGAGNPSSSFDNTFLTAESPQTVSNNSLPPGLNINSADKTPPKISLTNPPSTRIFKTAPTFNGAASDEQLVQRVEYSINNGKDWLPADTIKGLNTSQVDFSFTPQNLDDGNYSIVARAIDSGGNTAKTTVVDVVIDQLPPLVGGSVISIGPQIINDSNNQITTLADIDERITLSAVGGATQITLVASAAGSILKSFSLTQSSDSGLWSGVISFEEPGTYSLIANSVDGAGNQTTKQINSVNVKASSHIKDIITNKPVAGVATVYILQPDSNSWTVWDGAGYDQANPQPIRTDGKFSYYLPAGKYYLTVKSPRYHRLNSAIFKLDRPSPFITSLALKPGQDFKFISWLSWSSSKVNLSLNANTSPADNRLIGQPTPKLSLDNIKGQTVTDVDLLGKPTLMTFINTWAPNASDQIPALTQLASNSDVNVEPIAVQENKHKLVAYNHITGYNPDWLADPNSTLTNSFDIPSLPTHYFIDRNGTVKKVVTGVLTKQELLNDLSNL
jgi:peroxiredoxin